MPRTLFGSAASIFWFVTFWVVEPIESHRMKTPMSEGCESGPRLS